MTPAHRPGSPLLEHDAQLTDLRGELAAAEDTIAALTARIDRALETHAPRECGCGNHPSCRTCRDDWPCPTVRALTP